jgi:hypothetical protein
MCEHMGAASPGFTPLALDLHRTADTIGEAARHGGRAGVLRALDRTLQTCIGCHATYRQEVVDEATWQQLTRGANRVRRAATPLEPNPTQVRRSRDMDLVGKAG